MGINWTDLGNIAKGAIERDKEITREDFLLRAENLKANQKILIDQKTKKYDRELKNYYDEKEKFDKINKMNKWYSDGTVSKDAYAAFALANTVPDFKDYDSEAKTDMRYDFKGNTLSYPLIGSESEINDKASKAQILINNETSKAVKEAKGNSFLINQILRRKEVAEKDLLTLVQGKLKAIDQVKMTEQTTDNAGLEVYGTKDGTKKAFNWKRFQKKNPDYVKRFNKIDDSIIYKSLTQNNNFLDYMQKSQILGTNTEGQFKMTKDDTEIAGLNPSAQAFIRTYKKLYDVVKSEFSAQYFAEMGVDISELSDYMSTAAINQKIQNILDDGRTEVLNIKGKGFESDMAFVAVVPLSVVDTVGDMIVQGQAVPNGGKGYIKPNKKQISELYKKFLKQEINNVGISYEKDVEFNKLNYIQDNIENNGRLKAEFIKFVSRELGYSSPLDNPNTPDENESITQSPKVKADEKMLEEMSSTGNSVIKLDNNGKVIPQTEGKYGSKETRIRIDPNNKGFFQGYKINKLTNKEERIFIPWEKIERLNKVDLLPPYLKLRYDTWKSKSGTTKSEVSQSFNNDETSLDNDSIFSSMVNDIEKNIIKKTE
jgi:hypothetical protein